jgi:hypothetical protein
MQPAKLRAIAQFFRLHIAHRARRLAHLEVVVPPICSAAAAHREATLPPTCQEGSKSRDGYFSFQKLRGRLLLIDASSRISLISLISHKHAFALPT